MKRLLIIGLTVTAMAVSVVSPAAAKSPQGDATKPVGDNFPGALAQKQAAMKQAAQEAVASGKATATGKNKVVKLAPGQFVELAFQGEDQIFTLLGEFGNGIGIHNHGVPLGTINHGGTNGPLHNAIPQPNRATDNTTIWTQDFSQSYYESLLYDRNQVPSMANWYLQNSSGQYTVDGYVGPWVQVPNNEAAYGSNYCGSIVCTRDVGRFMVDQTTAWYNQMLLGMTAAEIDAFLAPFDVWDRYDYDGDGEFDEADGYIDHFQSVHAGEGEETGGGAQGTDAIWSHRSYANAAQGPGPTVDDEDNGPTVVPLGGLRIGNSSKWIGDYTIEPENGGVGVFAHEFGHDLGLPDEYDTSGNTGGAENSTAWWTNWSQGSYGSINENGLGMYPVGMTAWEKFQLGFLNYSAVLAGTKGTFHLGPVEYNTKKPQGMFIVLPDKEVSVTLGAPAAGPDFYYSGSGDNLDTSMTRSVTLPAAPVNLSAQVRMNIETDWDYAYLTVNGNPVHTNLSTNTSPNGQNFGEGITGVHTAWTALSADLSAFAGQTVTLGFRYWTDVAQEGDPGSSYIPGFQVDAINVTGQAADMGGFAFTPATGTAFHVTTGTEIQKYFNAYVLENRTYAAYDEALQKGPYNFTSAKFVEHFADETGLLVWYWDTSLNNNNVGDHPGSGEILPVDSHPGIEKWADGSQMRPRLQSYDSPFNTTSTHAITVHNPADGVAKTISAKPGNAVFNDSLRDGDGTSIYWTPGDPSDAPGNGRYQAEWNSVNVPNTGTVVRVKSISSTGEMVIDLNK